VTTQKNAKEKKKKKEATKPIPTPFGSLEPTI
jgi:hypothetical protein